MFKSAHLELGHSQIKYQVKNEYCNNFYSQNIIYTTDLKGMHSCKVKKIKICLIYNF